MPKKMKLHGLMPVVSSPLTSAELKSTEALRIGGRRRIAERKAHKIRVNKKKVLRISEGIKKSNFNKAVVLLIIVVLGLFLFTFFQNRVKKGKFPLGETKVEERFTKEISPTIEITGETYTVKPGDTLRGIALRAYGDENAWVKIAQANGLKRPNYIQAGTVLRIPR